MLSCGLELERNIYHRVKYIFLLKCGTLATAQQRGVSLMILLANTHDMTDGGKNGSNRRHGIWNEIAHGNLFVSDFTDTILYTGTYWLQHGTRCPHVRARGSGEFDF